MFAKRRTAVTLIELLIAVAVVAILLGLVTAGIASAFRQAERCQEAVDQTARILGLSKKGNLSGDVRPRGIPNPRRP